MLNEGVDIPEIDTILFLRPTESLTIFIQQLGRGLRLSDGKNALTVLDFVAQANAAYNYESRFRQLMSPNGTSTTDNIERGFPFLPPGCTIKMEPVARDYVLENIKNATFNIRRLRREVASFTQNYAKELTLPNFIEQFGIDWRLVYKTPGSWSELKSQAGISTPGYERTKEVRNLENGLVRLYHVNSYEFLSFIQRLIQNNFTYDISNKKERKFAQLFYYDVLYYSFDKYCSNYGVQFNSFEDGIAHLAKFPYLIEEMQYLVDVRMKELCQTTSWIEGIGEIGIELYGCYSADEIHLLCENALKRGIPLGTLYNHDAKLSMVMVTTNKADKEYSPSTLYKDYAINESQFHWQSKNDVRIESREGQRFIHQKDNGWKFLLFVRDSKKDAFGNSNCYYCLGLMDYDNSEGECPMNITWKMQSKIPGFILEKAQAV